MTEPAVWARLDPGRLATLLLESVRAYSPSYGEGPATQVFAAQLEGAGLAVERQPVPSPSGAAPRANLLVRLGPQPPAMLWIGHVDTVEAEHAFPTPRLEGDRLYGLGAADMKGGCAAMVEAVIALAECGVPLARGLCLGLVVGEEEYGDGALALSQQVRAPLVLDGEPTGLQPCICHHGYLECQLTAQGSRAHAAVPEAGANAIHTMLSWLVAILDQFLAPELAQEVAANPRAIQGGGPMFMVPASCQATLDVHWRPALDSNRVLEAIERARLAAMAGHPHCGLTSVVSFASEGYQNPADAALLEPFWRACRLAGLAGTPASFRSHSDAPLFQRQGSVAVVCGPGRLELAHSAEEHVSMAQVQAAARFYAALASEVLT
jgi:acetylornithine deacetylase